MAVRTATVAAALVALLFVRFRLQERLPEAGQPDANTRGAAPRAANATMPSSIASKPDFDVETAAARFHRDVAEMRPGEWAFLTEGPVLAPGAPGEWDDFTVASPWVLKESVNGLMRYRMWYRGCHVTTRERTCAVGHAISPDGLRWTRSARPVFEPADLNERQKLHGLAVVRTPNRYLLWYSLSPDLFDRRKGSTLHLATSSDGFGWQATGEVLEASEELPYPLEPSVLEKAGILHLWFVDSLRHFKKSDYAEQDGAPYLMHFTSTDGQQWKEGGRFPLGPTGLGRARVTVESGAGTSFHATAFARLDERWSRMNSADGDMWNVEADTLTKIDRSGGRLGDASGRVTGAAGLAGDGGVLTWFVTSRPGGREEIRVGFRKGE